MPEWITGSLVEGGISLEGVLLCTLFSLVLGLLVSGLYMYRNTYNKGFVVTLALMPAIIQVVIMLVNGNLGAGVAVMGAFSLVRFRSVPGNARDIGSIFLAMAIGLATGMGYLFYALLVLLLIGAASLLLIRSGFGGGRPDAQVLKITIPETLDYEGIFDDLFLDYTRGAELLRVRTTNMGSLYELTYSVQLKSGAASKAFLDALRCRNGNLNIVLGRPAAGKEEL